MDLRIIFIFVCGIVGEDPINEFVSIADTEDPEEVRFQVYDSETIIRDGLFEGKPIKSNVYSRKFDGAYTLEEERLDNDGYLGSSTITDILTTLYGWRMPLGDGREWNQFPQWVEICKIRFTDN